MMFTIPEVFVDYLNPISVTYRHSNCNITIFQFFSHNVHFYNLSLYLQLNICRFIRIHGFMYNDFDS